MSEENDKDMAIFEIIGLHHEIMEKLWDPTLAKEKKKELEEKRLIR